MQLHDFLRGVHEVLKPRSYLEIGVRDGRSLALSRAPSIGVDPKFKVTHELRCDVELVKSTSDDFFARQDPLRHLTGPVLAVSHPLVDLAFIDGMHLSEFALRDFINVEKVSSWSSVIVVDDVLPRNVAEAARDRHTGEWAGDVFKTTAILREYRPDLITLRVNTDPTGVLLVFGADPTNPVLSNRYGDLERMLITPDPQDVPIDVLDRIDALDPAAVLGAPFWPSLVSARNAGVERMAWDKLSRSIALMSA